MKRITLKVSGMHCVNCATNITKALKNAPGVSEVNVSFASGKALVLYDEKKTDTARIIGVIKGMEFPRRFQRRRTVPARSWRIRKSLQR
jgi:copper chaperone CopZ